MSPESPKDPFEGFDWSKQDKLNPQFSSSPNEESQSQPQDQNPPSEAYPPTAQPTPHYQSAPNPGTYYAGEQNSMPRTGQLTGTLTAFMILEWITFGFGVFGFCASLPNLFFSSSAFISDLGGGFLAYLIFTTIIGLVSTVFAFLSAYAISKRKKVGITYGWIEVSISWASVFIGSILTFVIFQDVYSQTSGQGGLGISIASSGIGLGCGIIFPTVKTILLSLQSTRESANRELS